MPYPKPLSLVAIAIMLSSSQAIASGRVHGFFFPTGGGANEGTKIVDGKPVIKKVVFRLMRAAVEQLEYNLKKSPTLGNKICILNYDPEADEIAPEIELFKAVGVAEDRFLNMKFTTAGEMSTSRIEAVAKSCGIVYLPGGDQNLIRQGWQETKLADAIRGIVANGGGLMGKSAGSAVIGRLAFYPATAENELPQSHLTAIRPAEMWNNAELDFGFLSRDIAELPLFYVETHSGDRERTARAAALMSAWESIRRPNEPSAIGIGVDVDTGVMIRFDETLNGWVADVVGARTVEFLFPTPMSKKGVTTNYQPFYTNLSTTALFEGGRVVLSGPSSGQIVTGPGTAAPALTDRKPDDNPNDCYDAMPTQIDGAWIDEMRTGSQVAFTARNSQNGLEEAIEDIAWAYQTGDLVAHLNPRQGCGMWVTRSYSASDPWDQIFRATRMAMTRYPLGYGYVDFAIQLPSNMKTRKNLQLRSIQLIPRDKSGGSAFLLYDIRAATQRKISNYTYTEFEDGTRYAPVKPIQIGGWINGKAHLLPSGVTFKPENGAITLPANAINPLSQASQRRR